MGGRIFFEDLWEGGIVKLRATTRDGVTVNGVRAMFHFCLVFKQTRIYVFIFCILCFGGDQNPARVGGSQDTELTILYKQSLQWWFHCI